MTTFAELRKVAQAELTPVMTKAGFALSRKKLTYWRKNGEVYHVILADLNRAADRLTIFVTPWMEESEPDYDMKSFPMGLPMMAFRGLSPKGLELSPSAVWNVSDTHQAMTTFHEVAEVLRGVALPWLDGIRTKENFRAALRPEYLKHQ